MPEEQADELASGIAGGADDGSHRGGHEANIHIFRYVSASNTPKRRV
jgi:hypothetical protein